jgi:starch synthase
MRILFVSSECSPLASTGGLGDAVAGLAHMLIRDHDVTLWLPGTPAILAANPHVDNSVTVTAMGRTAHGDVHAAAFGRLSLRVWASPLFDRPGLYGDAGSSYSDNDWRFIAFARAAAYHAVHGNYDLVVAHDWQAALALSALRMHTFHPALGRMPRLVQVVHNNAHQGRFPASSFALTGLAADWWHPDGAEAYGELCLLKAGLVAADHVVTVSPTYAKEIHHEHSGEGLAGLYQRLDRAGRLSGIVNGIDVHRYPFSVANKSEARQTLIDAIGVDAAPHSLVVAIGRLAAQKGFDVLAESIPGLVQEGFTVAVLGDGDRTLATRLHQQCQSWPGRAWFGAGFDDARARQLYAAADLLLVPSRFEPCGLVQLLAQRHGAWPVAHRVGGLCDTIQDDHTGTLFAPLDVGAVIAAAVRARSRLQSDPGIPQRLATIDVSWDQRRVDWERVLGR